MTPTEQDKELREKLAAIEHERWADWQKWVHKVLREANPSPEIGDILERWDRQIETPYEKLSEKEKDSDREQVDRYWQLIIADRKRVALEARLEERQMLSFHRAYGRDYQATLETLEETNDKRIAQLKAQQEEV